MKDSKKEISDQEVLEGLKSEKRIIIDKVLERLYVQNFPVIRNFIRKNSGNDDDAADIFQNTIVVFYKKVRLGNLELNCSIQTYLYSICRNLWLDELRAKKKKQNLVEELKSVEVEASTPDELNPDGRIAIIMKAMNEMGADCKKILGLFYFDRLRMREIATEMGYANEKVAKNIKARCMKKLKNIATDSSSR